MKYAYLILSIILISGAVFAAPPGVPHQFFGSVTINGALAADGTVISARISGIEVKSQVTVGGTYGYSPYMFFIEDPEHDRSGSIINFFVNGENTGITAIFSNFATTNLNINLNSLNVDSIVISPIPAYETDNLTAIYTCSNGAGGPCDVNVQYNWFKNGASLNINRNVLTNGNYTTNNNIIASVRVFNGTSWSSWRNSSMLTIGDDIPPIVSSFTITPENVILSQYTTFGAICSDSNSIDFVHFEVIDPASNSANYSSYLFEGSYILRYTPLATGTYSVKAFCRDGSGNMASSSAKTLTVSQPPSPPSGGGSPSGGGGGISTPPKPKNTTNVTVEGTLTPQITPSQTDGTCTERWLCTDWSWCVNGINTRTCEDVNKCGTDLYRPMESQPCGAEEANSPVSSLISGMAVFGDPTIMGGVIVILVIVVFVLWKLFSRKPKNNANAA